MTNLLCTYSKVTVDLEYTINASFVFINETFVFINESCVYKNKAYVYNLIPMKNNFVIGTRKVYAG